jgi:hypothetical protein
MGKHVSVSFGAPGADAVVRAVTLTRTVGVNDDVLASIDGEVEHLVIHTLDQDLLQASSAQPEAPGLAPRRLDLTSNFSQSRDLGSRMTEMTRSRVSKPAYRAAEDRNFDSAKIEHRTPISPVNRRDR